MVAIYAGTFLFIIIRIVMIAYPQPSKWVLGPGSVGPFMEATALVALGAVLLATWLNYRYATRLVLRTAGARPVGHDQEPDLWRTVESLRIGAGLPVPQIYVVEALAPNAFAAGLDPERAALVVTRGLLRLLDRRELQGVIAHELSHIGHCDIRLNTILAALGATLRFPLEMVRRVLSWLPPVERLLPVVVGWLAFGRLSSRDDEELAPWLAVLCLLLILLMPALFWFGIWTEWHLPTYLYAWFPFYVLLGAPAVGFLIRGTVSQERELLADADAALLTRNPEGLALALAKMGAASGARMRVGGAAAHLYIVDPLAQDAGWGDRFFPSHPPIAERIALLARMGSGIAPEALRAAAEAGAKLRQTVVVESAQRAKVSEDMPEGITSYLRLTGAITLLYAAADAASAVEAQLPGGARVMLLGVDGDFLRVKAADHTVGYISGAAPKAWL